MHSSLQDLKAFSKSFTEPFTIAKECITQVGAGRLGVVLVQHQVRGPRVEFIAALGFAVLHVAAPIHLDIVKRNFVEFIGYTR